jgi:4-amino-4-deoxy-L-arabinose transferase-like glycosyltransferase
MASESRAGVGKRIPRRWTWGILALILALAAFLRVYRLDTVPPGLTHDESAHLQDARRIWEGARPIYLQTANGREPFFDYVTAPLVGLFGLSIAVGRVSSVLWGLALIVVTYLALKQPLGEEGALAVALLMAVSFWSLSTSRQALRSITMPVLFAGATALFWRGLYADERRRRWGCFAAAGALLGLDFYTYMPARAMWAVLVLFWLSLALTDRRRFVASWRGVALMLVVMVAMAAPLLIYLARFPEVEQRVLELAAPLQSALAGDFSLLWARLRDSVLMFSHLGDTHWMYNVAGRPLLPPSLAILFYLGIAVAFFRLRRPVARLLLLWLGVGIAPAMVTGLESSSLRAIAAQPAVFGLCVLPLVEVWERRRGWVRKALVTGFVLLSVLIAAEAAQTYFVEWAGHRDVRVAYHTHLMVEADYLDQGVPGVVGISTFYPRDPHDPSAMEALTEVSPSRLRWFDGRGALVFPAVGRSQVLIPSAVSLDPVLEEMVEANARVLPALDMEPTDLVSEVAVFEWDALDALQAQLAAADRTAGIYPAGGFPACCTYADVDLPVELGGHLTLLGYRLFTPQVEAGGEVVLVTFWQVHAPVEAELALFAQMVDEGGLVVGQVDRLDAPAWNWHAGEAFAQVHRFLVAEDAAPGFYHLQVGAYRRADWARLPVLEDGNPVDDRILLHPLEVE